MGIVSEPWGRGKTLVITYPRTPTWTGGGPKAKGGSSSIRRAGGETRGRTSPLLRARSDPWIASVGRCMWPAISPRQARPQRRGRPPVLRLAVLDIGGPRRQGSVASSRRTHHRQDPPASGTSFIVGRPSYSRTHYEQGNQGNNVPDSHVAHLTLVWIVRNHYDQGNQGNNVPDYFLFVWRLAPHDLASAS